MAKVNYDDYLKRVGAKTQVVAPGTSEVNGTINQVPRDTLQDYLDEYDRRESSNYVPENEPLVEPKKSSSTTPVDTKSMWDKQKMQLAQSSVNQKAELAAINQKANSYVNAYMKALGLSGTSAGASQISENGLSLANAYSQVNANEQQALNEQRSNNSELLMDAYKTALENDETSNRLEGILDSYDDDAVAPGVKEYLRSVTPTESTWEYERDLAAKDLEDKIASSILDDSQKKSANELLESLNNAEDSKTYKKIIEDNQSAIDDITTIGKTDESTTTTTTSSSSSKNKYSGTYQTLSDRVQGKLDEAIKSNKSMSVNDVKEEDFGDFNGTGEKGDTQYIWANVLIDLAKRGELPENTAIDMNVGARANDISGYVYKNGKWYKTGVISSDSDGYAHADNSISSIKKRLKEITNKDWDALVDEYAKQK